MEWLGRQLRQRWVVAMLLVVFGGYWLVPISGQVLVTTTSRSPALLWPQMQVEPVASGSNQKLTLQVTDVVPWTNVLLTVDGQPINIDKWWANAGGTWTWRWSIPEGGAANSEARDTNIAFFRDCDTGCVQRGQMQLDRGSSLARSLPTPATKGAPTKLGVVFADPGRDWYGRSGWDVELTYARLADKSYWGIDDLAARTYTAQAKGLRVLVRVDYDQGQSLPPADDYAALAEYLRYVQRLARDERLKQVYGYVIGSSFNALDSNGAAPDRPVTAAWYARIFSGYGESPSRTDNVVQAIRAQNSQVKVLVGPVRPWIRDQSGERPYRIDVPWLDYMNSLVAYLNEATQSKAQAGIPMAGPDGFAVQAPGRVSAASLGGSDPALEPSIDLLPSDVGGAQAGFRVYRDWLAVINDYTATRGLPVYITSSNTFAPDEGTAPSQNYPKGWLTNALQVVDAEPQVQALIWFLDGPPGDRQWESFNLSRRLDRLADADDEFQSLLKR